MSDIMLQGVLRMPPKLWSNDPLDVAQRHARYVQAADEIDRLRALLRDLLHGIDDYWRTVGDGPRLVAEAEAAARGDAEPSQD